MAGFEKLCFRGAFRNYQERVLQNAGAYLSDGKLNLVAAPGSGKTVLGLELIRRLGMPCIIFSPTTAIRAQWGQRLAEDFLSVPDEVHALYSEDLHTPKLINSVTYQALFSAVEKVRLSGEDCSDLDLFDILRESNIRTICLDEAHHLKNEWQRALEKFVSALDPGIKIISLTATPPYDAQTTEWQRYVGVCGEIDEEISVPELVRQHTLCPHQDYIYFNYPTEEELSSIKIYRQHAEEALLELRSLPLFGRLYRTLHARRTPQAFEVAPDEAQSLFLLLREYDYPVSSGAVRRLTGKKILPFFRLSNAEKAIRFLLHSDFPDESEKTQIKEILKKHGVFEKGEAALAANEKLNRRLVASAGKLDSIAQIARTEYDAMKEKLRLLILTDYIGKENLSQTGKDEKPFAVHAVSIFRTLLSRCPQIRMGLLSGSLMILPRSLETTGVSCRKTDIPGTDYCTVTFSGPIKNALDFFKTHFASGEIQLLVGTKSLLGEGWDAPFVNTLILASFVGSFVLSNQMRGRAIRVCRDAPQKSANIWHLVSVLPTHFQNGKIPLRTLLTENQEEPNGMDFELMKRRFDTFMGPNDETGRIESGIERITAIKPPYSPSGFERINREMCNQASHRERLATLWEVSQKTAPEVKTETRVPKEKRIPAFTFWDLLPDYLASLFFASASTAFLKEFLFSTLPVFLLLFAVSFLLFLPLLFKILRRTLLHLSPARSIRTMAQAVLKTLQCYGHISPNARVCTKSDKEKSYVSLSLANATLREQNLFNEAVTQLLSPIGNPRYILIAKTRFGRDNERFSFACPDILGKRKEAVLTLEKELRKTTRPFSAVFTRSEEGRKKLIRCRRRSYLTANDAILSKMMTN